jgi:hypothetical protein
MALNNDEKQIAALLAQKNPDTEYLIRLSSDEAFAREEISGKMSQVKEELLKEKESHESHMSTLEARLEKIGLLLSSIEVIENANS